MDYDQEKIEERYDSLPEDLKAAISSVEIGQLVANIADKNGLMLDQAAELMNEVAMVMLGVTPSDSFTSTIAKKIGMENRVADTIAGEVNEKIFDKIRQSLQKIQKEHIEQEQAELNVNNGSTATTTPSTTSINRVYPSREEILQGIEDPQKTSSAPVNILNIKKEIDIADHMLSGTVTQPPTPPQTVQPQTVQPKPVPKQESEPQPPRTDPYREQI